MKVLIISHNPFSTYQSMGKTFLSLFSEFDKNELCQLYIYPTIPDIDVCQSYYRITDKDILKSYVHFGKVKAREIKNTEIDINRHEKFENKSDEKIYNKKKNYTTILARDIMWKLSRYYNDSLKLWIEKEKPTCIFLAPGEAKFIYDIALKISKKNSIPIVTYICDEFYFVEQPKEMIGRIQLFLLQKKIEKVMRNTKQLVTICDELNQQYTKKFDVPALTIMTGTNFPIADKVKSIDKINSITYLGNLAYKRNESILEIGEALDKLKQDYNIDCTLKLYTGTLDEQTKEAIKKIKSIEYCGYVTGKDFLKVFKEAQILLHVESFDKKCVDRVKNSISTKIADSLGSGIPLLAYGPKAVASISYLYLNDCACVILEKSDLVAQIKKLILNDSFREVYAINGLECSKQNHNSIINSKRLYQLIEKIINVKTIL